jgi:hypothetical protein
MTKFLPVNSLIVAIRVPISASWKLRVKSSCACAVCRLRMPIEKMSESSPANRDICLFFIIDSG